MRPPRGRAPPGAEGPCPTFGTTSALPGFMESMEFVVTSFELGELKGWNRGGTGLKMLG